MASIQHFHKGEIIKRFSQRLYYVWEKMGVDFIYVFFPGLKRVPHGQLPEAIKTASWENLALFHMMSPFIMEKLIKGFLNYYFPSIAELNQRARIVLDLYRSSRGITETKPVVLPSPSCKKKNNSSQ